MPTIAQALEYLLSGIRSTSAIINGFIRAVPIAHADLTAVARSLSDLRLLLEMIREESSIPVLLQTQMLPVFGCCGNVLVHIDTTLSHCREPEPWTASGQGAMASCRDSLGIFREALALALEMTDL